MSDDQWLREGLADAVPEPPRVPERPDRARSQARRARRTRLLAVGGAAAVVIASVGAGIVVQRNGDNDVRVATNRPSVDPLTAAPCPKEPVDAQTQVGPDHVPDGATSVRLCQGKGNPIDIPFDALTTMVDEVAASVNDLPDLPSDAACTMELGPGYQLAFTYPDGKQIIASGELYGCRPIVVDGVERQGADVPLQRFVDLLREQRSLLSAPASTGSVEPDCGSGFIEAPMIGTAADLSVAVLCIQSSDGMAWRQAEVTAPDVAVLRDDMATHTQESAGVVDCASAPPFPVIVGRTAWGDLVVTPSDCAAGRFVTDQRSNSVWTPGPEAQKVIDRLVAEAR